MRAMVVGLVGLSLLAAACGGGDDDSDVDAGTPSAGYGTIVFSVAPGTTGLPGTAVAQAGGGAAASLFTSDQEGIAHVAGQNQLFAGPEDLGLVVGDDLDAVSVLHGTDTYSPLFFSVRDPGGAAAGAPASDVRAQSDEGQVPGDVFQAQAFTNAGFQGTNFLHTDEARLGLAPAGAGSGSPRDELDALDWTVQQPPGQVFYSVTAASQGAPGGAIAAVAPDERGCTIFRTPLSGVVDIAWTCAQLGLAPGDEIDALLVFGSTTQAQEVWFTLAGAGGAVILASTGAGTNRVVLQPEQYGLVTSDDTDALGWRFMPAADAAVRLSGPPGGAGGLGGQIDCLLSAGVTPTDPARSTKHTIPSVAARLADPEQFADLLHAAILGSTSGSLFGVANDPVGAQALGLPSLISNNGVAPAGPVIATTVTLGEDVPLDDDTGYFDYAVVLDLDGVSANNFTNSQYPCDWWNGTDLWIVLRKTPGQPWKIEVSVVVNGMPMPRPDLAAAVVVFGPSLTFLLPTAELPAAPSASTTVRATAFRHGGDFGQSGNWSGSLLPQQGDAPAPVRQCD